MILAIEGPDRVGKTTLFENLRSKYPPCKVLRPQLVYVPNVPMDNKLLPVMDIVQHRTEQLWKAMHCEDKLYVCDRHPIVSNFVYSRLYSRPLPPIDIGFAKHISVLLLTASVAELKTRPADDQFDPMYEEAVRAYDKAAGIFVTHRLPAHLSNLVESCISILEAGLRELTIASQARASKSETRYRVFPQ